MSTNLFISYTFGRFYWKSTKLIAHQFVTNQRNFKPTKINDSTVATFVKVCCIVPLLCLEYASKGISHLSNLVTGIERTNFGSFVKGSGASSPSHENSSFNVDNQGGEHATKEYNAVVIDSDATHLNLVRGHLYSIRCYKISNKSINISFIFTPKYWVFFNVGDHIYYNSLLSYSVCGLTNKRNHKM